MKSLQIKKSITDRSNLSLNDYLKDISKIPMLSKEKEIEIAKESKLGNKKACDKLVTSNLRFVISVAKQYQGQGLLLIDLINEGNIGLIKAAEKFDVNKGFRFISYAVWWIRQSILQAISDQSRTIRLPMNQVHSSTKIFKTIKEFQQKNERPPSNEELEDLLDIPAEKINKIINSNNKTVSVDTPFKGDEEGTLIDVIPNHNSPRADYDLMQESNKKEIDIILSVLGIREQDIIRMYFGIDCKSMTLEEIGNKFGITNERARQIKEKAIKCLRTKYINQIKNII